jgi:hypothetical protein
MLQTDFNFVSQDFDIPVTNAKKKLLQLIEDHDGCSISVPYFKNNEKESIDKKMPKGWNLIVEESENIAPDKIRITVYNAYSKAKRAINKKIQPVTLKAKNIGGDYMIINQIEPEYIDAEKQILELDSATGNSPYMILITPGSKYKIEHKEFPIKEIDKALEFIKSIK